ncbi:MAG TPA: helix-turn-helix domain-containing protein, partial [Terriglobales bacterium]|nr:helix-turn-helix domain-containing protein [Terriglobales bacterium]
NKEKHMNQKYYTVEQISTLLGIHPKTVQRYIREGKLHATKLGKGWRVGGHDLSVFMESAGGEGHGPRTEPARGATASSVIDIPVVADDDAIRIMNALTGALSSKPAQYSQSSMRSQYIESENMIRVTLWGDLRFMTMMMDMLTALTDPDEKE